MDLEAQPSSIVEGCGNPRGAHATANFLLVFLFDYDGELLANAASIQLRKLLELIVGWIFEADTLKLHLGHAASLLVLDMKRTYNPTFSRSSHKYNAQATIVDGIRFASKFEAERYGLLRAMERGGSIKELTLQPRYKIEINNVLICTYVADFFYKRQLSDGTWAEIVEDAKGVETTEFKLKKKLMKAVLNIDVNVVKKRA